ncbi:MAG: LD-carboxypeptidase [Candidatus Melainabacteria bacterium]|nr:MAG: LD-carboxypeptidase [Candidatus Melainabacteria bacterium]
MPMLKKPQRLREGDTVGIIAPSSPAFEQGHVEYSFSRLKKLGLKYKLGKHVFARYGDLAGRDEARVEDLHTIWADPEVKMVMPLRGGTGSVRLLPKIDFELLARNPKILVGFSDITGLLVPIHQQTGLVTFHGPTLGNFFEADYTYRHFKEAVMGDQALGAIEDPPEPEFKPKYPPPRMVLRAGRATGQIIGGSLTLIKQMLGTPFEIETTGKIFFIEDVGEEPHSIERMLVQLKLANKFQGAAGIIVGESVECKPGESGRKVSPLNDSLESVLREQLGDLDVPVVYGLRLGHGVEKFTMPLGVMATLDATDRENVRFSIDEVATS